MSIEDQPTQQLRRPSDAPTPEPLNPTRPQPAARAENPDDDTTDVISLDNLFERQATATAPQLRPTPASAPVASTQPVGPAEPSPPEAVERRSGERRLADRRVAERRAGAVPAAPVPASPRPAPNHRLRSDTTSAVHKGVTRTGHWFTTGDNALIVVTALVALALILVIGLV